ncbi:hypothetical protein D3C73_647340 [compost metagenome]
MSASVIFDSGVAHFVKNIVFNRKSHCKIVRINTLNSGLRLTDVMEVVASDGRPPLLRRVARIHVDSTKVGEHFAYVVDVVVFDQMIVAKDQNTGMRGIMNFVMRHAIADASQDDARIVCLVIIGKIVQMGIFHVVVSRFKRIPAASVQDDRRSADMVNVTIQDSMVDSGCRCKVVIQPPARRIDLYAAVRKIANFAVLKQYVITSHNDHGRIAPVLQSQILERDIRNADRIDHRRLQHGNANVRLIPLERHRRQEV